MIVAQLSAATWWRMVRGIFYIDLSRQHCNVLFIRIDEIRAAVYVPRTHLSCAFEVAYRLQQTPTFR